MTAKEFVRSRRPMARVERQKQNGPFGKSYYLIRELGAHMYIGSGETEAKAWKDAKESIEMQEAQAQVNLLTPNPTTHAQ